mmetsp:Transcript_59903/g.117778  ORF Transcript_59903/g.117778 Transcript_59903/m.117778 type:complete len:190 (+) Transcript_59903:66-635(+)
MCSFVNVVPCGGRRAHPSEPAPLCGGAPLPPRLPPPEGAPCPSATSGSTSARSTSSCESIPRARSTPSVTSEFSTTSRLGADGAGRMKRAFIKEFLVENDFVTVQSSRKKRGVVSCPLHEAAKQGNVYMVRVLLEAGANPMRRDSAGRTAEQVADALNRFGRRQEVLAALREAMYGPGIFGLEEDVLSM